MNMMEIRCDFPDTAKFHAKYQRNNKRTGLKNLRCYPFCGPDDTHHENGFCGASVRAIISVSGGSPMYDVSKLVAWGELISKSEFPPRFAVGTVFNKAEIKKILRTDSHHLNPLFEAHESVMGSSTKQFLFDSQKKGWHYEWKGNKYTSEKPHAFVVYVAAPVSGDSFQCLGAFYSPEFTMFCRRRHKTVPEAEKNQMALPVPRDELLVRHYLGMDGRVPLVDRSSVPAFLAQSRPTGDASDYEDESESDSEEVVKPRSSSGRKVPVIIAGSATNSAPRSLVPAKRGKPHSSASVVAPPSWSAKRARPDRDGTDLKLMRVLAAIANLDKLKRRLQQDLAKKQQMSSSASSTAGEVPQITDDDLDMSWLDAISGPLQESFMGAAGEGADMFMPFKGGSVDDIFDMVEPQEEVNRERVRAVEVVEELARFIVEEDSLTTAIHETASRGSYSEFLQLMSKQIGDFLNERFKMTIDDLDSSLRGEGPLDGNTKKGMKSAFETLVSAALMRDADESNSAMMTAPVATYATTTSMSAPPYGPTINAGAGFTPAPPKIHSLSSSPSNEEVGTMSNDGTHDSHHYSNSNSNGDASSANESPRIQDKPIQFLPGMTVHDFLQPPKPLTAEDDPDVAGVWLRPESNTAEMTKWRERREMDWVQRQLIAKMEKRFEFEQPVRGQLVVRLSRKLLSAGVVTYHLDGKDRPFALTSPLGPASSGLAKTMSAWAIGPCVVICNEYSDTERLMRCLWKIGEDELHGVHLYQSRGKAWEDQQLLANVADLPAMEGGWRVVHMATLVCARDKSVSIGRAVASTSSEAETEDN